MNMEIRKHANYCQTAIRCLVRELLTSYSHDDAMRIFHERFPHYREYRASFTYWDLRRAGYNILRDAADRDTWTYYDAIDEGREPPFEPADSPYAAYERYGLAS